MMPPTGIIAKMLTRKLFMKMLRGVTVWRRVFICCSVWFATVGVVVKYDCSASAQVVTAKTKKPVEPQADILVLRKHVPF